MTGKIYNERAHTMPVTMVPDLQIFSFSFSCMKAPSLKGLAHLAFPRITERSGMVQKECMILID